ncbi:TlpA family protein disulfide reductase [Leptospira ryugenii]|uniref:TlpA family protein disulfide reductase n=1 Tax=Leptospira ryugenii TaxID=1917863 RepID=UPI0014356187|nr:TlpA disulfide reductase family protein [Leptospira ryugenii]
MNSILLSWRNSCIESECHHLFRMSFFFRTYLAILLVSLCLFCGHAETESNLYLSSIRLKDTSGKEQSLQNFKGKVLVVDFWATWCEPCQKSIPVINEWKRKSEGKPIVFLGVNSDQGEGLESILEHKKDWKMDYPSLLDPEWKLTDFYTVEGLPCLLVFSPKGVLVYRQYGIAASDLPGLLIRSHVWAQD